MPLWVKEQGNVHQGLLAFCVRKAAELKNKHTGRYLELDVWIPELHICFEFQDSYHYTSSWYNQSPLESIQQSDWEKQEAVIRKESTLIVVPFWWNGKKESLVATIKSHRQDLLNEWNNNLIPIPLNPPRLFSKGRIPDVGELMLASFPLSTSVSFERHWWLGEKYDGVRFCWNSIQEALYTKSGLLIQLHDSFYDHLPSVFLDGEIWFGRGSFQESQCLVISDSQQINWDYLRLISFDDPFVEVQQIEFENRYSRLIDFVPFDNPAILSFS